MSSLAPWLTPQLQSLMQRSVHAFLLQGPSGLGQYELGLALAAAWLCQQPTAHGACGTCPSCHGIEVRAHSDLTVLMPETGMLELGWPLSEKAQKDIDEKNRKPSREIRVESMRQLLGFTQTTGGTDAGKVVLISPAERMNTITANTLLKTLEEPPGNTRFILACNAAHELLPTVRSRCQSHSMLWPTVDTACEWLTAQDVPAAQAQALLQAAGGRPEDALALFQAGIQANHWRALPQQLSRGDAGVLADNPAALVLSSLQKLCHDMLQTSVGGAPRYFQPGDLPKGARFEALSQWSRELLQSAKTVDHPYQQGLLVEAWVNRAQVALSPGR
ncbi:MAG: DNA polymerase III subunit delta' [Burkholderiales bacterium]|nr:DNA polymerase III subunit delta' [Burkholderiales bacterium]